MLLSVTKLAHRTHYTEIKVKGYLFLKHIFCKYAVVAIDNTSTNFETIWSLLLFLDNCRRLYSLYSELCSLPVKSFLGFTTLIRTGTKIYVITIWIYYSSLHGQVRVPLFIPNRFYNR